MIYIVCSTGEGVDYAVQIDAVFVNKRRAIAKCKKLNRMYDTHWVWSFQEGQSYEKARVVYPYPQDRSNDAPDTPQYSCYCAAEMYWDTEDEGRWSHVDTTISDHEAAPLAPTPEPPQLPPGATKTDGNAFRKLMQKAKDKGLPFEVKVGGAGNGDWKEPEPPQDHDA